MATKYPKTTKMPDTLVEVDVDEVIETFGVEQAVADELEALAPAAYEDGGVPLKKVWGSLTEESREAIVACPFIPLLALTYPERKKSPLRQTGV
jgi:hypothetical protein